MELDQLRALVTVIELGSFSTASQTLGISRATLRGRIDGLEAHLGLQLLVRSQRGAKPTEIGERFAVRARELLREADGLASFRELETGEVSGRLRVLLPLALPSAMNARFVMQARARYPALDLLVVLAEDPLAASLDDYDLILYFGDAMSSGPYRTFVLSRLPLRAMASPAYLDARGRPASLAELGEHPLMSWRYAGFDGRAWPVVGGEPLAISPALTTSDPFMLRLLASAGQGIALIPDPRVIMPVPEPELELVLPQQLQAEVSVRALLPEATSTTPRSRAAVELSRELAQGMFGMSLDSL